MLKGLDLRARGVLLTLLCMAVEGGCSFNQSSFARELGLSRQELRTALKNLASTNFITNSATNSGTNSITNLTLNLTAIYEVLKAIKKPIQQPIRQPIQQPIKKDSKPIKSDKKEAIDWESFMAFFNEKVKDTKIPQIRVMTESRKRQIRSLLRTYDKKDLARAVDVCVNTPFLRGENNRGWTVDVDWIYTEKHFVKIMEGNYDWQGNNDKTGPSSGRSQGTGATLEGVAAEILRGCQDRADT